MPWLRRSSSRSSASSPTFSRARCRAGRTRPMPLMPATATQPGVQKVFDVRENVKVGVRHLRYLMDRYQGNLSLRWRPTTPVGGGRALSRCSTLRRNAGACRTHPEPAAVERCAGERERDRRPRALPRRGPRRAGRLLQSADQAPIVDDPPDPRGPRLDSRLLDAQVSRQQLLDGPDPLHSARSNRRQ